jgi:hypothetical protein
MTGLGFPLPVHRPGEVDHLAGQHLHLSSVALVAEVPGLVE